MFCSKYATKKVSSTQARALRAINMDFTTSRDNLLDVYDEIPIHTYNLRCLLTEVYKSLHGLNPEFPVGFVYIQKCGYGLSSWTTISSPCKS